MPVVVIEAAGATVFASTGRLAPDPAAALWSFPDARERRGYFLDQFRDALYRWLRDHPTEGLR